jgi:hypothetical protein
LARKLLEIEAVSESAFQNLQKGAPMSQGIQRSFKLLSAILLALFALVSPNLFAAEHAAAPSVAAQPTDLAAFLDSLKTGDQGSLDGKLTPAPENKVIYCQYQGCPTGQTCWYCHNNWVCIFNYPDPTQVPPGCSGGPL